MVLALIPPGIQQTTLPKTVYSMEHYQTAHDKDRQSLATPTDSQITSLPYRGRWDFRPDFP
eukprot:4401379-Pyramimonas_sp.AAC.1